MLHPVFRDVDFSRAYDSVPNLPKSITKLTQQKENEKKFLPSIVLRNIAMGKPQQGSPIASPMS